MTLIPNQADALVIGSGFSGLTAAVTLAEGGAKVVVFEKERSLGGSSNFIRGTFAVESDLQHKDYITYSCDQAFKNIMEYSHWRANPRLVRAIVDESSPTITWFQKLGVGFTSVVTNIPDTPPTYHIINGSGEAAIKVLATKARELGATILPGISVKQILKTNGRITGVTLDANGEDIPVSAKAVIIASGGYANNKELIKKHTLYNLGIDIFPFGNMDKTGDGLRMAFQIGAADEGLGILEIGRASQAGPEGGQYFGLTAVQPDLFINAQGERFCDESITFVSAFIGNANAKQKEGCSYTIFDNTIKQTLIEKGAIKTMDPDQYPGSSLVDLDRELEAALVNKNYGAYRADSIQGLAEKISVNPAVLQYTVDQYNEFCDKGHDDLFAKDRKYLRPVKDPPFYAVKAHTIFLGTLGGIKINQSTEVIDKESRIIPGLYAVGFDAGGMWGNGYCIKVATGLSSAFASISGRIAGKNALEFISK